MNNTFTSKTFGLMLLSMVFGGSVVYLLSDHPQPPKSVTPEAPAQQTQAWQQNAALPQNHPTVAATDSAPQSTNVNVGSIDELVVGLRNRLEANPSDVKGWVLLAKSYQHLGQPLAAEKAAEKARALGYKKEILTANASMQTTPPRSNPHTIIRQQSPIFEDEYFQPSTAQSDQD